jgi:type IV pilus assembly protein PilQ
MRGYGGAVALLVMSAACTALRTEPIPTATELEAPLAVDQVAAAEPAPLEVAPLAPEPAPAPAPEADLLSVRDVRVEPVGNGRRVHVMLSRTPDGAKDFVLREPPRVVVDLAGPLPRAATSQKTVAVSDDVVSRVRSASNGSALRVVVDLKGPTPAYSVRRDGPLLVADLGDTSVSDAAAPAPLAAADAPQAVLAAAPEPAVAPVKGAETNGATSGVGKTLPPVQVAEADPLPPAEPPPPPPPPARIDPPAEPSVRVVALPPSTPRARDDRPPFTGQRVSLDFKDADVQNVLRVLADVSGLNIIATDDVKGKVTLHLSDVPWDQALDLILRSNRLEMTREGNVVRISTVERLKEEREALRAAQDAERELEPLRVRYVRVNYARADESLIDKVKGVLTERGSVTFDERTNTIIVRDIPRGIDDANELIRQLDVQSPQVLIEANIVEATEDFARGLGVQWGYAYRGGPGTGTPTGMNFPGTIGLGGSGLGAGSNAPASGGVPKLPVPFLADFPVPTGFGSGFGPGTGSALDLALGSLDGAHSLSTRLTALEEEGKGKVISRPRVITMNNVAATIQSLTIIRVKMPSTGTVINTGTGGVAGGASTATEKINTGITLVVTPQISADGYVLMNIYAKSSQPDFSRNVDGIPSEVSREANSNVLIQNGETVVLGGIFRNTSDDRESGLPYLRRVPAVGWLFKRLLRTNHREELLVFLTPKIVTSGTAALPSAERLWEERRQGG